MRLFFLFSFMVSGWQGFSQDSIACYFDKHWKETTIMDSALYFRVGERLRSGEWYGTVQDYYKSGKIQMTATFINDKKEGLVKFYYENGQVSSMGKYSNNQETGEWISYYENGAVKSEGKYLEGNTTQNWVYYYNNKQLKSKGLYDEKGNETGLWQYYYMNGVLRKEIKYITNEDKKKPADEQLITFSDSLGNVGVKNGSGKYSYFNPKTKWTEEGIYEAGVKTGQWTGEKQGAKDRYTETYNQGKLEKGESVDEEGKKYTYTQLQAPAEYPGGMQALMLFMKNHIKYPADARKKDIQGKVYIEFIVDTRGKVTNVKVKRGVHESLDQEAMRVINKLPDWTIARDRGKPVRQRYVIPVNFKITETK